MILLIDTLTLNSPGMLQLKNSLINAILNNTNPKDRVFIIKNSEHDLNIKESSSIIELKQKQGLFNRWLWYNIKLPRIISENEIDVFYSMSGILSKNIARKCKTVTTVNNMLPFQEIKFRIRKLKDFLRMILLKTVYLKSLNMADSIVLHSKYAQSMIESNLNNIAEKVYICYTGVPDYVVEAKKQIKERLYSGKYILYFTAVYPYKNHINLIKGYKSALEFNTELPDPVLAGIPADQSYVTEIEMLINDIKLNNKIKYFGELPQNEIVTWMSHSEYNIFASTCETNSVILSELLSVGRPIIASDIEPMKEILGRAALYFDPFSQNSIKNVILKMDENDNISLMEECFKRVEEFSWDNCGLSILNAVKFAMK